MAEINKKINITKENENKISEVETKLATLKNYDDTEIKGKVTTLESKTNTIESDITTLETKANTIESKVTTAESNITQLQEDVANGFSQDMIDAGIQKKIDDGTIANLVIDEASITPDKTTFMKNILENILTISADNYAGYMTNEPTSITYTEVGVKVIRAGMCGVFYKINTEAGQKYSIKVKMEATASDANVRAYASDKTTELVRTTLTDGYYTGTFTAKETTSHIRFFASDNFEVSLAKVFKGESTTETYKLDSQYIPNIDNIVDMIPEKSLGLEKMNFVEEVHNDRNIIENNKISSISTTKLSIPVTLKPSTKYYLYCYGHGDDMLIAIRNKNSNTDLQTIVNWSFFNGNNGVEFTTNSSIEGDCIIFIQTAHSDLSGYIGSFMLNEIGAIKFEDGYTKYKLKNIKEEEFNSYIKCFNIKPTSISKGNTINNAGTITPNADKKYFNFEEILPDTWYYLSKDKLNLYALYDKNMHFISWNPISSAVNTADRIIFKTPSNAAFVRGAADIDTDLSDMILCPTLHKQPLSSEDANKIILNPRMFTQNYKKSWYEGKKLTTDGDSLVAMGRWQQRVVDNTGMIFLKNCGVGGSKVTEMCGDARVAEIPEDTEVLILWAGANDWGQTNNATPIGTIDDPHDNTTYYGAYQLWLDKIFAKIPDALKLICIQSHRQEEETPNHLGFTLEQYREATRKIAYKYGITTVDLMANMGVNNINHYDYFSDIVHINDGKGGKKVSELITRKLLEIEPFFI